MCRLKWRMICGTSKRHIAKTRDAFGHKLWTTALWRCRKIANITPHLVEIFNVSCSRTLKEFLPSCVPCSPMVRPPCVPSYSFLTRFRPVLLSIYIPSIFLIVLLSIYISSNLPSRISSYLCSSSLYPKFQIWLQRT